MMKTGATGTENKTDNVCGDSVGTVVLTSEKKRQQSAAFAKVLFEEQCACMRNRLVLTGC